jgi:transcription initiation factor TFIID subunit 2
LQLTKIFQKKYCFTPPNEDAFIDPVLPMVQCIPRPNNFANLVDYFLQKAVVAAFALIRDENGLCPLPVCKLLLDLLKYNDNTGNEVSFGASYSLSLIFYQSDCAYDFFLSRWKTAITSVP